MTAMMYAACQSSEVNVQTIIHMWFFNAEAGVCETFIYSGCQGNGNQFESWEACEQTCVTPAPTSCVEKREMALSWEPWCIHPAMYSSAMEVLDIAGVWTIKEWS